MQTAEKEMKDKFGFVPKFFGVLPEASHDQEWAVMRDFGLAETVIPNKYKELIGLAVAAQIKCRYCMYFHTQAARAFGASDEELREAAFMGGYTVQFSNSLSGMQLDLEEFKKEVDRCIQHMTASPQQPSAH